MVIQELNLHQHQQRFDMDLPIRINGDVWLLWRGATYKYAEDSCTTAGSDINFLLLRKT